jgi:hypothetical protein
MRRSTLEKGVEKKPEDNVSASESFWGCSILLVLALVFVGMPGYLIWVNLPDSIRYAMIYQVKRSQIHIDKEPTDCDWGRAPLGDKGCHYKKDVNPIKYNGQVSDVYITWERHQD